MKRIIIILSILFGICSLASAQKHEIKLTDTLTNEFLDTVTVKKKLKLNDEEIKTKKRVAERMLKVELINSNSEYLDVVLRRTDNPSRYVAPEKAENIANRENGMTIFQS